MYKLSSEAQNTLAILDNLAPTVVRYIRADPSFQKYLSEPPHLAELQSIDVSDLQQTQQHLRRYRKALFIHTAALEAEGMTFEEPASLWSDFADIAISIASRAADCHVAAQDHTYRDDCKRISRVIFALGKLGTRELNPSSDVDLMVVYRKHHADAQIDIRLQNLWLQTLIRVLSENTSDGFVFRIDMDLRPEGRQGPLLVSSEALLKYHQTRGRFWERVAMLKRRAIYHECDPELFYNILDRFVDGSQGKQNAQNDDMGDIGASMAHIRARIEAEQRGGSVNIKTGPGCIRDIEFLVHFFQLKHIRNYSSLRHGSTLYLLEEISKQGLLAEDSVSKLRYAYSYFRRIEHILQYASDAQVHVLPHQMRQRAWLNRVWSWWNLRKQGEHGADVFKKLCIEVRSIFLKAVGAQETYHQHFIDIVLSESEETEVRRQALLRLGFRNVLSAERNVSQLHMSQDRKMCAAVLSLCCEFKHPDRNLKRSLGWLSSAMDEENRVRFLNGLRSWFYWSEQSPWLYRVTTRGSEAAVARLWVTAIEHSAEQGKPLEESETASLDAIFSKCYRKYVRQEYGCFEAQSELASSAEAWLEESWKAFSPNGDASAVIWLAYGSLANEQLIVGSDLDLVLLYGDSSEKVSLEPSVRKWLRNLHAIQSHGDGFKVDFRLRPHGRQGPLLTSWSAWLKYQSGQAQFWEHLALIRSRFLFSEGLEPKRYEQIGDILRSRRPRNLGWQVLDMRERMKQERGSRHGFHVKVGDGGLADIDFTVAAMSWMAMDEYLEWMPNMEQRLEQLYIHGHVDREDKQKMLEALKLYQDIRMWYWFLAEVDDPVCTPDHILERCGEQPHFGYVPAHQLYERLLDTAAQIREITGSYLNRMG